ncbi:complement component C8 beta chain [Panthera tigris]|uniref:complement component C8 beta chain n=1 Tax=Panthera tigris TaxID=9694 RepID=UPI001C6F991C|nr:complement component C8 beta chain [Panthera tigris]
MLCSLPPNASPSCLLPPPTPGPLVYTCSINSNRTVFRHVYTALNALQVGFINARSSLCRLFMDLGASAEAPSRRDNEDIGAVGLEDTIRTDSSLCCPRLPQFARLQYRHAYLLRPSQFNGEPCNFSDKEVEDCVTSRPCRSQVQCEGFVCAQTGRCVNRRLLCNGDNDCGDQSDEANCRRIYKKCQHEMDQYWAIGRLASGINLFTNSFEGPVLDHRYYAGGCSPHYILNTRFRKPYNVESYTPQTQGKYEFVLTEYESYSDFERSITERGKSMSSSGFGFKIPGIFEVGISSASAKGKHFIRRIKRFSHTKSTFLHARSDLEVARYKLKPRSLMLHYELLQRVKLLPLEYSYGEYRDLFRDFGTHYITEAVLGGIYEYTLIMNKEAMERADYSLKDVQACAKNDFKIGAAIEEVYVSLGVSVGTCQGILREIKDRNKRDTMVDDLVVLVRGGASEHITALAYKELPTADLMQEWGDAVQYNPDIIKIKAEPLYELVTATDFAYSSTVRQNMKRALEEFQKEVSSCHCAPCQGNGVPVLKESRCECICPVGFQGPACEVTSEKNVPIDGKWNCWSDWSPCSGGQKTRQRQCNHPPPQNGGSPCVGPASETLNC